VPAATARLKEYFAPTRRCGCRTDRFKQLSCHAVGDDLSGPSRVKRLKKIFSDQMQWSRRHGHYHIFLECYAGTGRVSSAIRSRGWGRVAFESDVSLHFDLLHPDVRSLIRGWVSGGCIAGLFFGTPCGSWSIARHGPFGSHWGPLRSRKHIMGLPGLPPRDNAKIRLGNATMRQTADPIKLADSMGIPVALENPASSRLFVAPAIAALRRRPSHQDILLDMWQFGAPFRKHTRLACWNTRVDVAGLNRLCRGKRGVCSRTQEPHLVLEGPTRTRMAQKYCYKFAHAVAEHLARSAVDVQFAAAMRFVRP